MMDIALAAKLARWTFDLIPVGLAIVCFGMSITAARHQRRHSDRVFFNLAALSSMLLILAQSSWWWSVIVGDLSGTNAANITWTLFNSTTMIAFMIMAWRANGR